jgi:hypothetical protein
MRIVHIGKGVAVSGKCVTDLLELDSILSPCRRYKDRLSSNTPVSGSVMGCLIERIGRTRYHVWHGRSCAQANLSSVETTPVIEESACQGQAGSHTGPKQVSFVEVTSRPPPVVNSETARRGASVMKTPGLLKHFLEFDLLVVLQ